MTTNYERIILLIVRFIEIELMSTSKKELVVKSNQVIEASYQLSSTEQRIVLAAISKISRAEDITDDEIYRVTIDDLKKLGVHEKTAYRDLKDGVNRLYDRSINLAIDDESIKMR